MARFPDPINNFEYFDIVKKGLTLLHLEGPEINGMSRTELSYLVGSKMGSGTYQASYKEHGDSKTMHTPFRAVNKNEVGKENVDDLKEKIKNIEKQFSNDQALTFQKQLYEVQLKYKDQEIVNLKKEVDQLNKLIDEYEKDNTKEKPSALETIMLGLLNKNLGAASVPTGNLSDNGKEKSNIPLSFLQTLDSVDWEKVSEKDKSNFKNIFESVKTSLPQK